MNLRIPGPTPLPPQVTAALQRPMINHRGPTFAELQKKIVAGLQPVLETKNDILILPSSGTGGLEAALVNVLSPGDRVLACTAGSFGERFAKIAAAFGAQVDKLTFPDGVAIEPERVVEKLRAAPETRAVLITHSETSTGVLHPVPELARVIHANSNALVLVDAVSSAGATRFATDEWGIDVVITGSQKALMSPPGAAILAISERAWHAYETARVPRFYWDWKEWKKWAVKGETPFTPALPIYFALDAALDLIHAEGLPAIFARHERLAELSRTRTQQLGFKLLPEPRYASPTVTALYPPTGVDARELIRRTRDDMGVEFAGGQGDLTGKIIRIGHLGYVHDADIQHALNVLEQALVAPVVLQSAALGD
ncbi:MAG: alanine--glyoxylate aminotransferase family protein [Chloroflexi bacterium]|nr:alanine--glyoxylate aminotransferase family protein [Chloroflexota bacterium]